MKLSWGHGVVIALGCFIVFILSMIFFFPIGKDNSELITDNYYEEELHYQDIIDAKNAADQLTAKPDLKLTSEGIIITFPEDINNNNSKFNFYLYRTNDQNLDIKKDFSLNEVNAMEIPKTVLVAGDYMLKLKWIKENKNYQIDYNIKWK